MTSAHTQLQKQHDSLKQQFEDKERQINQIKASLQNEMSQHEKDIKLVDELREQNQSKQVQINELTKQISNFKLQF